MQSSKIEFLTKYNYLLKQALESSKNMPDNLCEFLVSEYELQAVLLFKIDENRNLAFLGRSAEAKKSYSNNSTIECSASKFIKNNSTSSLFEIQADCEIQASEYVMYEGCLYVKLAENEDALFKIAKKTPFSNVERDNLQTIGEAIGNLLKLWVGKNPSDSVSTSQIISEIAHELRTPTNSIMGFASLLHEDNLSSSQAEYVSTLKDNAFNLLSLINDLIDLAKIDSGINKEVLTLINIKSFIDEVIKLFSDKINKNKLEFIVNLDKDLPDTIRLDHLSSVIYLLTL